ncbi:MAG: hypothetical protein J6W61_02610, partial [Bacteroidales bacterium]|nr:hypothetical protein [Bacteroidales bacterium]
MKKETKKQVLFTALFAKIAILAILFSFSSCDEEDPLTPTPTPGSPVEIELTEQEEDLIDASNSFTFKVFKKITDSDKDANVILSPFSISEDLSMLLNGAVGETQQEIIDALEVSDLSVSELNAAYKSLTNSLLNVDSKINAGIANSIWTRVPVLESFSNTVLDYYNAETYELSDGIDVINDWIREKTNGMIENGMENVSTNSPLYLINALFFKGDWQNKFDKTKTSYRPFTLLNNGTVDVPMMIQENSFKISENERVAMLEIPYGQGNYVMDVLLPKNSSEYKEMFALLNIANFNDLVQNLRSTKVTVEFPKFKYQFGDEMSSVLSSLGITKVFSNDANLSNMTN